MFFSAILTAQLTRLGKAGWTAKFHFLGGVTVVQTHRRLEQLEPIFSSTLIGLFERASEPGYLIALGSGVVFMCSSITIVYFCLTLLRRRADGSWVVGPEPSLILISGSKFVKCWSFPLFSSDFFSL